ncbi:MAG: hypothetical protein DRP16_05295 [Candidatus Aenigmatarchaeota archaeon]|nr:MAG: hypothetical protein DRP16_05295 [Candidatus Aenigmarchaeota archaeon]
MIPPSEWEEMALRNRHLYTLCKMIIRYIEHKKQFNENAPAITKELGMVFTDMMNIFNEYLSVVRRFYNLQGRDEETLLKELRQMIRELTPFEKTEKKAIVVPVDLLKALKEFDKNEILRLFNYYTSKFDALIESKIYYPLKEALIDGENYTAKKFAQRTLSTCGIFVKEIAEEEVEVRE